MEKRQKLDRKLIGMSQKVHMEGQVCTNLKKHTGISIEISKLKRNLGKMPGQKQQLQQPQPKNE
jgi:hypothetical protein